MSDWRHNSSGYWSNQGSGHEPRYPSTIDEEVLGDQEDYAQTGEDYTYTTSQDYQAQGDQHQHQQQGYWTDEPQTYHTEDQTAYNQQYYQGHQYYQSQDDQGEVTYTPTTYTGSMDVNYSVPPSEHGHSPTSPDRPSPLAQHTGIHGVRHSEGQDCGVVAGDDDDDDDDDDRLQEFVAQRQDSYNRREEFRTAPDTASIRRVVDARRRVRDSEAARARAVRERERNARAAAGSGGAGGGGSSSNNTGRGGGGSSAGSGSGKHSASKGSGSKGTRK